VALLLKGGRRIVDPAVGLDEVADMIVRDGRIVEIGPDLTIPKGVTIECAEKIVVPGLVDIHTCTCASRAASTRRRSRAGARAAAHGGFTAVCAMPNTTPVCDTGSKVRFVVERAAETAWCASTRSGALTVRARRGEALAEMGDMVAEGAVAFTDDGHGVQ
jgi:dihydroorotase